jgi:lipopolysaccharide transport system permease protein
MKHVKTILYLRTDLTTQKVVAGGSVAHTLGVIKGFISYGVDIVGALSFMGGQVRELKNALKRDQKKAEQGGIGEIKDLTVPRIILSLRWRISCILANFFYILQIAPLFKRSSIDAIYQRYSLFNMVGVIFSTWKKVPLILEYNGSEVWIDKNWGGGRTWGKFLWLSGWIEKVNLKNAAVITVVSEVLKEELISRGVDEAKITVNPNAVDVEDFNPAALHDDRIRLRTQLGLQDKVVFGFIGTFSVWHGIEVFESIIPSLVSTYANIHFLMIGHGPLLNRLYEHLKTHGIGATRVTFTGMVPQQEAKKYLAACDAFLSPTQPNKDGTRFFGSPTKLFEYMSLAKPIIASDLEQLTSILTPALRKDNLNEGTPVQEHVALLVDPLDKEQFTRAVGYIMNASLADRDRMGSNARAKATLFHTWHTHVGSIIAKLQHVMALRGQQRIVIDARKKNTLSWSELWSWREVFYFLVWRDILVRYKQTVIGVAWVVIRPLITMIIFSVLFGRLAGLCATGAPYPLLVLSALLPWQFFSDALFFGSNSLVTNAAMINKIYFPRLFIPLAAVVCSLLDFVVSLALLVVMMLYYRSMPGITCLMVPFFLLWHCLLTAALTLMVAALMVRYRDIKYLVTFGLQVGLYVSPIGFSSKIIPPSYKVVYALNPLVGIIDGFRWALIGEPLDKMVLMVSLVVTIVIVVISYRYFNKAQESFADLV